jgi:hypothetical protein
MVPAVDHAIVSTCDGFLILLMIPLGRRARRDPTRRHALREPVVSPSPLLVDRGNDPRPLTDHPGGVAVPGAVFHPMHVARPQAVEGTIPQADCCLAGQRDAGLPSWRGVPVTHRARSARTDYDALGAVERRPIRVGRQSKCFHVQRAIVAGLQAEHAYGETSIGGCRARQGGQGARLLAGSSMATSYPMHRSRVTAPS